MMGERRREMMSDLIKRAQRVSGCLGRDHLGLPHAFQPGVASSHIFFFIQLVENLEKVCADLDAVVESECRDLLSAAGELIFSNLWLLYDRGEFCRANFSLDEVLKPVQTESKEVPDALAEKITGYMGALCDLFADRKSVV